LFLLRLLRLLRLLFLLFLLRLLFRLFQLFLLFRPLLLFLLLPLCQRLAPQSPLPAAGPAPLPSELDLFQLDSKVSLMAIRVTVASKSEESILDVPANVTVYSAQDIKALGYYTLADLANITAGYSSYTIYGEKVFETRGQKAGSFNNNKHLLLIDGIPVSHARANSLRAEEELPLLFARQVEFLRGPASALYGVSAFFGVLNIRPREQEQNGLSVETNAMAGAATGGAHQATVRVMSSAVRKTEDGESRLNLGYFDRGSSLDFVGISDDPNNLYRDRRRSIFLDLSHRVTSGLLRGIGAGAIVLYKDGGMGEGFLNGNYTQDRNNLSWLTAVPYLRYTREFAHGLRVNSYLKYNYSIEKGEYAPFSAEQLRAYMGSGPIWSSYESRTHDIEFQAELHWQPTRRIGVDLGVNVDSRQDGGTALDVSSGLTPPYTTYNIDDSRVTIASVFAQYKHELPLLQGLLLTAGGRVDIGTSAGASFAHFSPRLALVQRLPQHFALRASYGTALRSPNVKELGLNKETGSKNIPGLEIPNLGPETFQSFDFAFLFNNAYVFAAMSGFYNVTANALDGVNVMNVNYFANQPGNTTAWGVEFEARFRTPVKLEGLLNYSFALATDSQSRELTDVPSHKLNAGLLYSLLGHVRGVQTGLRTAVVMRWIKDYRVGVLGAEQRFSGNFLLDLNFIIPIGRSFDVNLQARNALDGSYKVPKNGLAETPLPRTELFGGVSLRL
jgi:outer membrane receptor for ferrienterochelin and colicins